MKPTLLILAAGMGSRYGGLKQTDSFGPNGESIIDYSIYDAIQTGFQKVVFVIRQSFAEAFKEKFTDKLKGKIETDYVFQELDNVPNGITVPKDRTKPWGTAHAVMVAYDKVKEPFAVINADDFYGRSSYQALADFFSGSDQELDFSIVGYQMDKTLSEHGGVSRAVCHSDQEGYLTEIEERLNIHYTQERTIISDMNGDVQQYNGKEFVSMNMMGFRPSVFGYIQTFFKDFIQQHHQDLKKEFYIPDVLERLISENIAKVKILPSSERWFGVTYPDDKPIVMESISQKIKHGEYPSNLWE